MCENNHWSWQREPLLQWLHLLGNLYHTLAPWQRCWNIAKHVQMPCRMCLLLGLGLGPVTLHPTSQESRIAVGNFASTGQVGTYNKQLQTYPLDKWFGCCFFDEVLIRNLLFIYVFIMQPKTTNIFKHMLQHKIPEKQQTWKTIWKIIWKERNMLNKHCIRNWTTTDPPPSIHRPRILVKNLTQYQTITLIGIQHYCIMLYTSMHNNHMFVMRTGECSSAPVPVEECFVKILQWHLLAPYITSSLIIPRQYTPPCASSTHIPTNAWRVIAVRRGNPKRFT